MFDAMIVSAEMEDEQSRWSREEVEVRSRKDIAAILGDVLPSDIKPVPDPDDTLASLDRTTAVTFGLPINVDDCPAGTWFYYGTREVGMRHPGCDFLCRVERRA